MSPALPPQIRVIVRDWLNSNQIVLLGRETVLVDSGYGRDAQRTLDLLRRPQELGSRAVDLLANTHCHSDHMGGNAAIARQWACPIAVPAGERPLIERWDEQALWLGYADQRCERFAPGRTIEPGESLDWGELEWIALPAPGHDMHALMFWCEEERVLISGDALWESGFGVILPGDGREDRLDATRSTLDTISQLDARVVIPGHGQPFSSVGPALERARRRLDALAVDEVRMARSVLKTMFVFSLLDRGPMPAADLPAYLAQVPLYTEYNSRYFRLSWEELARWLVEELSLIGAVEDGNGFITAGG
jgi:glyoxylase-like metal-dependent hydrolase (beta-lactamase superfamily II)